MPRPLDHQPNPLPASKPHRSNHILRPTGIHRISRVSVPTTLKPLVRNTRIVIIVTRNRILGMPVAEQPVLA